MPKREFQLTDGKSDKFWTISLKGNAHTVVYGRNNTSGRTLSKTFDTPSEAKASYTSLIESKLKRGYRDAVPKKQAAKKRPAKKVTKKASGKTRPVKRVKKKPVIKRGLAKKATKKSTARKKPTKKPGESSRGSRDMAVSLNDLTRRMNMFHCDFRNNRGLAEHFRFVWMKFFRHTRVLEPWVDAAVLEIGPTILVRPACTALDESHRSFVRPLPSYSEVKGYKQELRKAQKGGDPEALERELMELMQEAILKGFMQAQAQKSYAEYNPDDRPFTVLVTAEDMGLHASELTVVWKNRRGMSASQVRKKQASVKGKQPVVRLVEESVNKRHIANLKESSRKEKEASQKYWAKEKGKAEQRKPAIRKKLAAQIELAEAQLSKPTKRKVN